MLDSVPALVDQVMSAISQKLWEMLQESRAARRRMTAEDRAGRPDQRALRRVLSMELDEFIKRFGTEAESLVQRPVLAGWPPLS